MTIPDHCSIWLPSDLKQRLAAACAKFWAVRASQASRQRERGSTDQGSRSLVTGGKQMDGFSALLSELLVANGVPDEAIFLSSKLEIPGYFRPTKMWDMLVVYRNHLLAAIELKSQVGSFGNNYNNRTEEAVGSATDIWTAYREDAFGTSRRPWVGYLFLLEAKAESQRPVRVSEPHFPVFSVFRGASYARRYEELCKRLVRERLYSEAALLLTDPDDVSGSSLREPAAGLEFAAFVRSLLFSVIVSLSVLDQAS